jgi:hypothetical protein
MGFALILSTGQGRNMSTTTLAPSILSQEERLEHMLLRRLGNRVRNLRVLVLPDGLILQGHTATYHAKQIAQHAVMELAEMPILANDIEVM